MSHLMRAYVMPFGLLAGLALFGAGCPGGGGGGGGGNRNENTSTNENANSNSNGNDNVSENDNLSNENDNTVENENDNLAENENDNAPENDNTGGQGNVNENVSDNENGNDNAADNVNDNTEPSGLPPENQRSAFQSQCAQNVITCTVSFPVAIIGRAILPGQVLTTTDAGFRIQGADGNGSELVQLVGSGSTAGQGATQVFFAWSAGAVDPNPCTLTPGEVFSTEADPQVTLQAGFHYIRLTVTNDLPPIDSVDAGECGTFTNYVRQDFEEIEVEIVD